VIPFCHFGVREDGVVAAGDPGFQTTSYSVIRGIVTFSIAGGVLFVLPVAVLWFIERVPDRDILVIASNDEGCIVEVVINDLGVCPSAIRIEESKGRV
jgi:hypothetical protein